MTVRSAASSANWWASELTDITRLLRGHGDGSEVEATAGGNARGDRAFDEWGVGEHHLLAVVRLQIGKQRKSGEDRAAEVGDEQYAVSGWGWPVMAASAVATA
jgi:hypothetical protein